MCAIGLVSPVVGGVCADVHVSPNVADEDDQRLVKRDQTR